MDDEKIREHDNDVQLGPLEKNGDKLISSVEEGNMVAVLSKNEVMYTFIYRNRFQCFIHPLDAPEGRKKDFPDTAKTKDMLKGLASAADQLFEIRFKPDMDLMGVMVAAEKGIIRFLDSIGQLPAEDYDFMAPMENEEDNQ